MGDFRRSDILPLPAPRQVGLYLMNERTATEHSTPAGARRNALLSALQTNREAADGDVEAIRAVVNALYVVDGDNTYDREFLLHWLCRENRGVAPHVVVRLVAFLAHERPHLLHEWDRDGFLPLHRAILSGPSSNVGLIRALVEARPESALDAMNDGDLALHLAIKTRAPESVIRLLVAAGRRALWEGDINGSLPLHRAAASSTAGVVSALAEAYPRALRRRDGRGQLPLHCAADKRNIFYLRPARPRVLQDLVSRYRPALGKQDAEGWLPLHVACRSGVAAEIGFLAHVGPRALRRPTRYERWVPLHVVAKRRGSSDADRHADDIAAARELVERWPRGLGSKDAYGWLPLHYAAVWAPAEVVRHFTESWPPSLRMATSGTNVLPLHLAAISRDEELVRLLAEAFPPALQTRNADGQLPLHCCVSRREPKLGAVKFLGGASPGALREQDSKGWLPLHHAAAGESEPAVLFLAEKWAGALQQRTNAGLLPLHVAAKARPSLLKIVQFLAEAQPLALQVRSNDGSLPLHLAAAAAAAAVTKDSFRSVAKIEYLANASPQALEVCDSRGLKPVHVAATHHAPLDAIYLLARMDPAAALRLGRPIASDRASATATLNSPVGRSETPLEAGGGCTIL
jgi:ankyrin repeat protein